MRALVLSVAVLLSAVASAQDQNQKTQDQGQKLQGQNEKMRPPPPGQPAGPIVTQPAPQPVYSDSDYEDFNVPSNFRRGRSLVVLEREALMERLARMEELLERAMERADRRTYRALRKAGEELNAVKFDVNNAPDLRSFRRRHTPPPPPPAPVVYPISEDQLQSLMRAMGRESFGEGKLRVLESAASTQNFLVPQVMKILQRFSFGEDKLDAVRLLWPRVLDRDNAFQLYQAFTFSGEKDELRQIIGR
ncbi:MAG: DUF4476 domain-containing protein [Myxococcaceae bacterium]|nr:DUF4476 domain-containing protein [Myxococcaceae bacterium]